MNITKSQWILQIANKIKQSTKNNTVIHMLIIFYVVNIKLYVSKCTSKILCSNTTQCVRICKNIQKCYTLTHTILGIYVGVFEELSLSYATDETKIIANFEDLLRVRYYLY